MYPQHVPLKMEFITSLSQLTFTLLQEMAGKGNIMIFFLFCWQKYLYTNFPVQIYLLLWNTGCFSSDKISKGVEQMITEKHCACGCPEWAKKKTELLASLLNWNKKEKHSSGLQQTTNISILHLFVWFWVLSLQYIWDDFSKFNLKRTAVNNITARYELTVCRWLVANNLIIPWTTWYASQQRSWAPIASGKRRI